MSLDLVKLDAMISSDSLPKVDRLRNVEETGHRTEFMSGAGVYFNSATSISNIGSYPTSNAIGSSFEGSSSSVRKSSTRRFNGVGFRNAVKDDIALPRATLAGRQTSSNTRSVPSLHARRNKIQPKVSDATWDIETLQELVMSYKRKVSELEKAQRLLRCQYQKTQERLVSKDREIDAILQKVAGGAALSSEKCLVKTLKHQVRTLQEMLSEKGAEFERLRSTLKNTQMEEMRIYCDDFAQEIRRLRLFNELGRTPENHVSISALEEIRSLRQECSALRHNNVELTNRLTQTELNAEQTRANDRKQFAERILKMETELRQERALVTEMEKIGDLTRAELAQVVSQTDTTRSALADSSAQIRLLKERLASLEMELAAQKAAAAVASEKSSKDFYDLLALKDSMEKKLFAEIKDLNDALEKQGSANAILRESERVLQGSVTDLKRILEETKESAQKEQQRLLEKLQKNENQIDALGVENRTVHADLSSIRSELELSSKSLRQSQQNYEDAKTELFALEKELAKTRADAEKLAADRNAELQLQMAELQSHQEEVARLRALHEQSSKKFHEMLKESAVPSANGTTDNEASKPTADNDIRKPEEILEANNIVGSPANNAFSDTAPTQSNDSKLADLPPNADVSVVEKSSAEPLADSQQVEDAKQENDSEKKPKVPREASSKPDGSKSKSNHEREDKHSKSKGHDKTEKDKDRSDKSGTKSEKKSDKKSSPKR